MGMRGSVFVRGCTLRIRTRTFEYTCTRVCMSYVCVVVYVAGTTLVVSSNGTRGSVSPLPVQVLGTRVYQS